MYSIYSYRSLFVSSVNVHCLVKS